MSTSSKRPPPAFQEYASDMLANSQYRMMSLSEKGLLDLLRRECWVNQRVPFETKDLAAYLGIPAFEIDQTLTSRVLSFFIEKNKSLSCPELDIYKEMLNEKREKLVNGGRNGGKSTQAKNKSFKATLEGGVKPLSRDELNGDELNKDEKRFLGKGLTDAEMTAWTKEYDSSPDASINYLEISKGC